MQYFSCAFALTCLLFQDKVQTTDAPFKLHRIVVVSRSWESKQTNDILYSTSLIEFESRVKISKAELVKFEEFWLVLDEKVCDIESLKFKLDIAKALVSRLKSGGIVADSSYLSSNQLNELRSPFAQFLGMGNKLPTGNEFKSEIRPVVYVSSEVAGKKKTFTIEDSFSDHKEESKAALISEKTTESQPVTSGYLTQRHSIEQLIWNFHRSSNVLSLKKLEWTRVVSEYISKQCGPMEEQLSALCKEMEQKMLEQSGLLPKNGNKTNLKFSDLPDALKQRMINEFKRDPSTFGGGDPETELSKMTFSFDGAIPHSYVHMKEGDITSSKVVPLLIRP